jgi:hypothetical protein
MSKGTNMIMLGVRTKYDPSIQIRRAFIRRQLIINAKSTDQLVREVKSYETPLGTYVDDNEVPLTGSVLVLYATTNPRDTKAMAKNLSQELIDTAFDEKDARRENDWSFFSKRSLSLLQAKCKELNLLTIDIDDKNEYRCVFEWLKGNQYPIKAVIETRGGYHILLDNHAISPESRSRLFKWKKSQPMVIDVIGDIMCPLPGTLQADYPVHFVDL